MTLNKSVSDKIISDYVDKKMSMTEVGAANNDRNVGTIYRILKSRGIVTRNHKEAVELWGKKPRVRMCPNCHAEVII